MVHTILIYHMIYWILVYHMVYSMVYHMVLISDFDGISQFLTCCADVWYHGFFWYIPWYITYFVVYTMLFEVLTCCADVWHNGFLWYVSFFPVICWVDLAYIPAFSGPNHTVISQRCVISGLWCDVSDTLCDITWYKTDAMMSFGYLQFFSQRCSTEQLGSLAAPLNNTLALQN